MLSPAILILLVVNIGLLSENSRENYEAPVYQVCQLESPLRAGERKYKIIVHGH
jgi:hypothetical protein